MEDVYKRQSFAYKTKAKGSNSNKATDIHLLARAINGEARGEPYEGQVDVGAVILNRVESPNFPNTIAGVIYQPGAFTAVSDEMCIRDSCCIVWNFKRRNI